MKKSLLLPLFILLYQGVFAQRALRKWNIWPTAGFNYTLMQPNKNSPAGQNTSLKNIPKINANIGLYVDYALKSTQIQLENDKSKQPFAFQRIHSLRFGLEHYAHTSKFQFTDDNYTPQDPQKAQFTKYQHLYSYTFVIQKWSLPISYQIKLSNGIRVGAGISLNLNTDAQMEHLIEGNINGQENDLNFFGTLEQNPHYTERLRKFQLGGLITADVKLYRRIYLNFKAQTYVNSVFKPSSSNPYENNYLRMSNLQFGLSYQLFKEFL